jgi:hypothetical protein
VNYGNLSNIKEAVLPMTKRILSIVLTVIFSVSMLATVAFADNSLVIHENVIFDLQSYGILQGKGDGDLALDDNVTRAEFCAFVVRLMRAAQVPYSDSFTDVSKNDWFAGDVAFLSGAGLVNGNELGEFRPNDNVSYTDAMKILVCALGYKIVAEESGGYPEGYISVGTKIRLNDGISANREDFLTRGAVVLMLHNALDIEILEPVSYGDTDLTYGLSGKTFRSLFSLDTNKDSVYMSTGIVTADYYSYLLEPVSEIQPGEVQINGRIYNIGTTNTDKFLGTEIEYYYKESKRGNPTIISSRITETNNVVSLNSDEIGSISLASLAFYDEAKNKEIQLRLSDTLSIIKNYQLTDRPYVLSSGEDICKNGFVKIIDNTGDGIYDLIITEDYNSYRVEKVSENGLYLADNKLFNASPFVKLDTEDDNAKIILENESGEKINLSDIKEDDVVSLLQSEDKSVIKCVKGKETVFGKLTEMNAEELYIDDKVYTFDYYYSDTVRVGSDIIAYLDFRGNIIRIELDDSFGKTYAYILESKSAEGLSGGFCLQVLIPGKLKPEIEIDDSNEDQIIEIPVLKAYNSSVDVLTLASKINYDGTGMTESEYSSLFSSVNLNLSPELRLISYRTNSEGFVTNIESTQRIGDGNYKVYNGYENVFGKEGTVPFGIEEKSSVVCVPENGGPGFDSDNYYASILINNGQRYQITGYNIDPETSVADIVVIKAPMDLKTGDVISRKSKLSVLSKTSSVVDETDGEVKTKFEFWSEGKKMSYFVSPGSDAARLASRMNFGDVFYYALDNVDEIYKISICELGNLGGDLSFGERGSNDTERSILGTVTNIDYNIIDIYENRRVNRVTVSLGNGNSVVSYDINRRNTPPVYILDTRTKTVKSGSIDDILIGDGNVFAHIREYSLKGIVIVK